MLIITAVVDQNVIVVVVDALRADRVGAIRDQSDLTPNIDRLLYSVSWLRAPGRLRQAVHQDGLRVLEIVLPRSD